MKDVYETLAGVMIKIMNGTKNVAADEGKPAIQRLHTPIFGTQITVEYVEKRLAEALKTSSKFGADLKMTRLGIGQGFLSVIARIEPDWTPKAPSMPQSIVVKIPTVDSSREVMAEERFQDAFGEETDTQKFVDMFDAILHRAHNWEVEFYRVAETHRIEVKRPKMYFSEAFSEKCKQGLLLLEDMGESAEVWPHYEAISVDEIKQVLSSIAGLHGFSIRHPECIQTCAEEYVKILSEYDHPETFVKEMEILSKMDEVKLAPPCGELAKLAEELCDANFLKTLHEEYNLPLVLLHGDLWSSNILWTINGQEKQLAAIVDWQMVHRGCAVEDIARFISTAMSAKDRREHLDDLLQHYYDELQTHVESPLPFSLDQLKNAMIRIYPLSMKLILPLFGPLTQIGIENKHPGRKEELLNIVREKAVGLAEDILYYRRFYKNSSKH